MKEANISCPHCGGQIRVRDARDPETSADRMREEDRLWREVDKLFEQMDHIFARFFHPMFRRK